ncbi:MAG: bifunctional adenosylcobinamide kinase/adenosylcobinamide-phosphate guanylyltransferase [Methylococcales bacterium]|nr:bifunctional adenosylcobinamide kinase/adenosylcobinamide-phosphate guanylyltransferase [Methylococcales bacterium]MBT7410293.1 bifunctional adenosylcobinamide kinase/adenosylcobinamide-phosphate guanylyltransferase [Methylococcales bacterium]
MKTLILGGMRSGKSSYAETLCKLHENVQYVATATADDEEMKSRIHQHQQQRSTQWGLIEEPLYLSKVLISHPDTCLLIDCLTLWVSNWLCQENQTQWQQERQCFLQQLSKYSGNIVLVSNEVGQGIIPMGSLSRQFCDETGWLHQALAKQCQQVIFMVAGLPQVIKG